MSRQNSESANSGRSLSGTLSGTFNKRTPEQMAELERKVEQMNKLQDNVSLMLSKAWQIEQAIHAANEGRQPCSDGAGSSSSSGAVWASPPVCSPMVRSPLMHPLPWHP
jgi:hypothetical protein